MLRVKDTATGWMIRRYRAAMTIESTAAALQPLALPAASMHLSLARDGETAATRTSWSVLTELVVVITDPCKGPRWIDALGAAPLTE